MIANNYDQYDLTDSQKTKIFKYYRYKDVPQQEQLSKYQIAQRTSYFWSTTTTRVTNKLIVCWG